MTEETSVLSRVDFDRLIARAITLDDEGNEQIDVERARAIANELGISASAWEAALRERESVAEPGGARGARWRLPGRSAIIAPAGIVAGALSGAMAGQAAEGVLFLGGLAVAAGVGLVVDGMRRRSVRSTQVELATWWLSVPAGIMFGMRELHVDPMVFAVASWMGCASLGFSIDLLRRRAGRRDEILRTS